MKLGHAGLTPEARISSIIAGDPVGDYYGNPVVQQEILEAEAEEVMPALGSSEFPRPTPDRYMPYAERLRRTTSIVRAAAPAASQNNVISGEAKSITDVLAGRCVVSAGAIALSGDNGSRA